MDLHRLLGITVDRSDENGATAVLDAAEQHLNAGGTVHGGALATMVDAAMGAAVFDGTDDDERPVTVEMKVNYLAPGRPGTLVATAKVRRRGQRFTVLEAEVTQDGELVVFATGTFTTVHR